MERCPKCGTKLHKTTLGRHYCPNHGIIDEDLESEVKDEEVGYAG